MSIRATFTTDSQGNITVQMRGGLDYANSTPLRAELDHIMSSNPHVAVTLDMSAVDFVGSSGIGQFVEAVCDINKTRHCNFLTLRNVKEEFLKVFKLYAKNDAEAIEKYIQNFDLGTPTRHLNIVHGGRKQTFQN